jgi:predicted SAM-dependent methyltransferase
MSAAQRPRRLNWGCGTEPEPGWINSDIKEDPTVDISCDILEGLPLEEGSIDYAVSIHALPELRLPDLVPALMELRRVLAPGGVLRLALPDLDRAIEAYSSGDGGYFHLIPDEDARSLSSKMIMQMLWYGYSKSLFTQEFIAELLERAGFAAIEACEFQQTASEFEEIVALDNRPEESLFVEARK